MSESLVENNLFAYTFDHFHSLKAFLNCFKEKENYEFYENYYDCSCESHNCRHTARVYGVYCKEQNLQNLKVLCVKTPGEKRGC